MKKATLIFLALFFLTISNIYSQRWKLRRYEAIVGLGTTTIYGDIGGAADANNLFGLKDIKFGNIRQSFSFGVRYKLEEEMSLKLNLIYGKGYGTDENSINDVRNLKFQTSVFESSLQYEYYFLKEDRRLKSAAVFNKKGMINNYAKTASYAFAGVGGVFFKPTLDISETTLDINNTDRHTVANSLTISGIVSLGLGLKYTIDDQFSIGYELGGRYSFSDLMDGYAFYSDANKHKDVYYFSNFTLIYKVRTDRRGRPVLFR